MKISVNGPVVPKVLKHFLSFMKFLQFLCDAKGERRTHCRKGFAVYKHQNFCTALKKNIETDNKLTAESLDNHFKKF